MLLLLLLAPAALAQELPKRDGSPEFFDFEPKLMLNDLPDMPLPASSTLAPAPGVPPPDVGRLEAELARAKRSAASRERLWKSGVLSKVEAEQGALKVVRLVKDLEHARWQALTRAMEERRKRAATGDAFKESLAENEAALATASANASAAVAKWDDAQRAAAEIRVQRERKLLALGVGSRSSVKRAEAALQSLAPNP